MEFDDDAKLQHLHYLINSLLPFLKQIREEQMEEIAVEALTRGNHLKENLDSICLSNLRVGEGSLC